MEIPFGTLDLRSQTPATSTAVLSRISIRWKGLGSRPLVSDVHETVDVQRIKPIRRRRPDIRAGIELIGIVIGAFALESYKEDNT